MIDRAESLYARLAARPNFVNFEAQTGPGHLTLWREAINAFHAIAGV